MNKKFICVLLALLLVISFSACGKKDDAGETLSKIDQIKQKGELVIGTDAAWAPFEYIGADGQVAGADIDLAQDIADALGVKLTIVNASFDTLPTYLESGEVDMLLSAMSVTEERQETISFSVPYTVAKQYIVVAEDNNDVTVLDDLAGKNIGVHLGTTGDFLISDEVNLDTGVLYNTGATVQQYKALPDACLDLKAGSIYAIVCDVQLAENLCKVNEGLKCFVLAYSSGPVDDEYLAIAMPKGDDDFVNAINEIITPIIENGTMDEYIIKHTELSSALN